MLQDITNRLLYIIFFTALIFGILLYNVIKIKSADELCALFLLLVYIFYISRTKDWEFNKGALITLCLFIFYFFYSIQIQSNSTKAIIYDLIIQLKPYLAFFALYQMAPVFSKDQTNMLKQTCILAWWILLPIGIFGFENERFLRSIMEHPTNYATCIISISLTYLLCSNFTLKEKLTFLIMLSAGIASGRSKFYGFFVIASVLIFYLNKPERLKIDFRSILVFSFTLVGMFYVAFEKIKLYFMSAAMGEEEDLQARAVLYVTSIDIFKDYMPFGSGLASFGTHASGLFYSKTYEEYGIDAVWGLSKQMPSFISDTYYPSLAQFGVVGACFYILFWIYIITRSFLYYRKAQDFKYIIITLLISSYLAIENIAEASFTSNKGFFMMLLLGMVLGIQKRNIENIEKKDESGSTIVK